MNQGKFTWKQTIMLLAIPAFAVFWIFYLGDYLILMIDAPNFEHYEVKTWYKQAHTTQKYRIPIDVYLASSPSYQVGLTDMEVYAVINGTNAIWNNYGIEFYILDEKIKRIHVSDDYVLVGRSGNTTRDGSLLGEKVANERFYDDIVDVVFIKTFAVKSGVTAGGIGLNYGDVKAAFISQRDYIAWNLAHELGHVLNNRDERAEDGIFTLMTHMGCIPKHYQPMILNQTQYDNVLKKIASIRHENLTGA